MGKWFPKIYDIVMEPLEKAKISKIRRDLIGKAEGRVLEIGSGTGANFPFYKGVAQVVAVEPNPSMRDRSLKVIRKTEVPIQTYLIGAEKLPFLENSFDCTVGTLVLCTIPNPGKALKELSRVCKPGGKVLFLEHVRLDHSILGPTQDVLTPVWKHICDGCHLNRDTLKTIKDSGLVVGRVKPHYKGLFLEIECMNYK
jgi:ubiquinone/menaquinone biosynthesis C-methylase UbiE